MSLAQLQTEYLAHADIERNQLSQVFYAEFVNYFILNLVKYFILHLVKYFILNLVKYFILNLGKTATCCDLLPTFCNLLPTFIIYSPTFFELQISTMNVELLSLRRSEEKRQRILLTRAASPVASSFGAGLY